MQRPVTISRNESNISVQIELVRKLDSNKDVSLAIASGFIWELNDLWYLVTNLHNLTGWDYIKNKSISESCSCPTHVNINFGVCIRSDGIQHMYSQRSFQLSLENNERPSWLVHPKHKSKIDVAILEICSTPKIEDCLKIGFEKFTTIPTNLYSWVNFTPIAGDDAYVLGFPHGMASKGFPIWKRASIASEPDIDLEGLPKLLIDTATRKGMSGSPVIVSRRGIVMPSGKLDDSSIFGESTTLLGVYSGRIGEDELGVQLGIVWKRNVIDEIIEGGIRGSWPWET